MKWKTHLGPRPNTCRKTKVDIFESDDLGAKFRGGRDVSQDRGGEDAPVVADRAQAQRLEVTEARR